jgi:hypothetical protein
MTLHYPLDALFSQIPDRLRPKIEKSKYHQQRDQITILIEGDISSREKETMAWEKVEQEYRCQNAKGTTDAGKALIAKLARNSMVIKDYAKYSKTPSRSRNSKKRLKK